MEIIKDEGFVYRMVIGLAAFVVVVAGMRAAQTIIVPFLLATFIAIISAPHLIWLQSKRVPLLLALLIVITVIVAIGFGLAAMLGTSLENFSQALPSYQERLQNEVVRLLEWVRSMGLEVSQSTFTKLLDPASAMRLVSGMLMGLGSILTNAFLILLTVIFILLEASTFSSKLRMSMGGRESALSEMSIILANINRYMTIKMFTSAMTGLMVVVGLAIIGVDFPVLWGFFAFLLNFIPNIGSFIAAVPAVLIALLQLGPAPTLVTAGLYLGVNVMIGSIMEPRWMGSTLGLSPLIVFLSLVFWGWVLGPVGMFLSVPLTISFQIVLASSSDSRWLAILLGPGVRDT